MVDVASIELCFAQDRVKHAVVYKKTTHAQTFSPGYINVQKSLKTESTLIDNDREIMSRRGTFSRMVLVRVLQLFSEMSL